MSNEIYEYDVPLQDYTEGVLASEEEIAEMCSRLGKQISEDYKGEPLILICVLKGGFMFMSDLSKNISIPVDMDFIAVSSYGASTKSSGVVRLVKDTDTNVTGKHVLLVEDIIDTGLTLSYLKELFQTRNPLSVKVCTAFDKPARRKVEIKAEYSGIEIPDEYVVGYGLDYNGLFRNLPDLRILKRSVYVK